MSGPGQRPRTPGRDGLWLLRSRVASEICGWPVQLGAWGCPKARQEPGGSGTAGSGLFRSSQEPGRCGQCGSGQVSRQGCVPVSMRVPMSMHVCVPRVPVSTRAACSHLYVPWCTRTHAPLWPLTRIPPPVLILLTDPRLPPPWDPQSPHSLSLSRPEPRTLLGPSSGLSRLNPLYLAQKCGLGLQSPRLSLMPARPLLRPCRERGKRRSHGPLPGLSFPR